jgi:hypothetical protein
MSFAQEIANAVTGNLATDFGKWMARKVGKTTLARHIEARLNPDQLHPTTRDVLEEALAEGCRDLQGREPDAWRQIFLHPENRLQLLGWVMAWEDEPEPQLGEWSLENAPNPDMLRGLLLRLHRIIQEKKRKHFSADFFNLLSQQMTVLQRQEETSMAIEDLRQWLDARLAEINALLQRPSAALSQGGPTEAPRYTGTLKLDICRRLVSDWHDLADYLQIPPYDRIRFDRGREPQGVWEWLETRQRLPELAQALTAIGRNELAEIIQRHPR